MKQKPILIQLTYIADPIIIGDITTDFIIDGQHLFICAHVVSKHFPQVNVGAPINVTLSKKRIKGSIRVDLLFLDVKPRENLVSYAIAKDSAKIKNNLGWRPMWQAMREALVTLFAEELEASEQREFSVYLKAENVT